MQPKKIAAPSATDTMNFSHVSMAENAQEQEDYNVEEPLVEGDINEEEVPEERRPEY